MRILIAIHGAHCLPEQREAQRVSWIPNLDGRADFRYFLGRPALAEDNVEYIDGEDGPVYSDSKHIFRTRVLHNKTEAIARYGLEHGYDYVFKCDDDTYIHVDNLLASGFEKYDYSGSMERLLSYPDTWYWYGTGGGGYWLSRAAMEIVAKGLAGDYPAEDGAVGYTLFGHNLLAFDDPRYLSSITQEQVTDPPPDAITLHKCDPAAMRLIHMAYGYMVMPNEEPDAQHGD